MVIQLFICRVCKWLYICTFVSCCTRINSSSNARLLCSVAFMRCSNMSILRPDERRGEGKVFKNISVYIQINSPQYTKRNSEEELKISLYTYHYILFFIIVFIITLTCHWIRLRAKGGAWWWWWLLCPVWRWRGTSGTSQGRPGVWEARQTVHVTKITCPVHAKQRDRFED